LFVGANKLNLNKKLLIPLVALVTLAVVLTAVTAAVLSSQNLPSSGTIQTPNNNEPDPTQAPITGTTNLDIYTSADATTKCTSIEWGTIEPGQTISRTIYIKNTGNTAQTLSMSATEWNPTAASTVLTLSWNKEATSLASGSIVPATLTLTVAADTGSVTSFGMNIVITGSA
jgi:hypothetical protein